MVIVTPLSFNTPSSYEALLSVPRYTAILKKNPAHIMHKQDSSDNLTIYRKASQDITEYYDIYQIILIIPHQASQRCGIPPERHHPHQEGQLCGSSS